MLFLPEFSLKILQIKKIRQEKIMLLKQNLPFHSLMEKNVNLKKKTEIIRSKCTFVHAILYIYYMLYIPTGIQINRDVV